MIRRAVLAALLLAGCSAGETPPQQAATRLAKADAAMDECKRSVGLADLTTDRLVREMDPVPMRVNSLTSNFLTRAWVPIALPTDRDVLVASLDTCWRHDWSDARMVPLTIGLRLRKEGDSR